MLKLLLIERLVLESIALKGKNLFELSDDTGISPILLQTILEALLKSELITFQQKNQKYSLNSKEMHKLLPTLNQNKNRDEEVKEIIENLLKVKDRNGKNKSALKILNVWLSPQEEIEYSILMNKIETLTSTAIEKMKTHLSKGNLIEMPSKNKKFILLGHTTFEDIVNVYLS